MPRYSENSLTVPQLTLYKEVFTEQKWRCGRCKQREPLQIHHKKFRSQGGKDERENLIALCATCHDTMHRGKPDEE